MSSSRTTWRWRGALWRTLAMLLRRPGQLTLEWLQGRRQRWVNPLRLYLSVSFVFFVTAALLPGRAGEWVRFSPSRSDAAVAAASAPASAPAGPDWLEQRVEAKAADAATRTHFIQRFKASVPYVVFALVPLFAGWLALAQRRRRMAYGAHMVLALHVHAFTLLTAWLATWASAVPGMSGVAWLVWAVANPLHLALAMRRVYGNSLPGALGRTAAVLVLHTLAAAVVTAGLLLLLLLV